ncbi:TM2 domain-containing protein [Cellulomonas sp.]|uniref:TM2 domain-containing protein n=1 Tax=Cellulomonas sp. TaxID=40001 RepID=UPI003BAD0DE0
MSMYPPGPYGYPVQDAGAPYGRDPFTGQPLSDKQKLVAGLLQIFLGTLGVGRFYTGHTSIAVTQLVLTVVGWITAFLLVGFVLIFGVAVWAFIDGVMLLATDSTDSRGLKLR